MSEGSDDGRARERYSRDAVLGPLLARVQEDADTIGIILHGSRGPGVARHDSDYDLDWVLTDEEYERRRDVGDLTIPPQFDGDRKVLDVEYTSLGVLRQVPQATEWMVPACASARVLFDKTGEVTNLLRDITTMPEEQARSEAAAWYDAYLNAYYRGMKAAQRGNDLGARLQSADSLMHLVRTLFALERRWPPYHDRLAREIDRLGSQGWNTGSLHDTFLAILRDVNPAQQQRLQLEVETLMRSRGYGGVLDAWGGEIERVTGMEL